MAAEPTCLAVLETATLFATPRAGRPAEVSANPWGALPRVRQRLRLGPGPEHVPAELKFSITELPSEIDGLSSAPPLAVQVPCPALELSDAKLVSEVIGIRAWEPWRVP